MTNFLLRDKLHRDTAPVPFLSFVYRDYFPATYKTCTATPTSQSFVGQSTPARNKICTMPTFAKASAGKDGKNCTVPVLHRDPFAPLRVTRLKYQDPARMLHQVTQPPFIAGLLCGIARKTRDSLPYRILS
jgi:hypothetical protein